MRAWGEFSSNETHRTQGTWPCDNRRKGCGHEVPGRGTPRTASHRQTLERPGRFPYRLQREQSPAGTPASGLWPPAPGTSPWCSGPGVGGGGETSVWQPGSWCTSRCYLSPTMTHTRHLSSFPQLAGLLGAPHTHPRLGHRASILLLLPSIAATILGTSGPTHLTGPGPLPAQSFMPTPQQPVPRQRLGLATMQSVLSVASRCQHPPVGHSARTPSSFSPYTDALPLGSGSSYLPLLGGYLAPRTQRAGGPQRKRQTLPAGDWWAAGVISYLRGWSWAPQAEGIPAPTRQNLTTEASAGLPLWE